jgi:predicted DNA-binding transcriptional regulator AlpA
MRDDSRYPPIPTNLLLDKRAGQIMAFMAAEPDELLSTQAVADYLGVSCQWLAVGRMRGYGPPFHKVSYRSVRYRRDELLRWLESRRAHRLQDAAD